MAATLLLAALAAGCGSGTAPNATVRGAVAAFNADLAHHDAAGACELLTVTGRQDVLSEDGDATGKTTCAEAMGVANVRQALTYTRMSAPAIHRAAIIRPRAGSAMLHGGGSPPRIYVLTREHGLWLISSF